MKKLWGVRGAEFGVWVESKCGSGYTRGLILKRKESIVTIGLCGGSGRRIDIEAEIKYCHH